jgi:hypothetical protein
LDQMQKGVMKEGLLLNSGPQTSRSQEDRAPSGTKNMSLTGTGRVDVSDFYLLQILWCAGFGILLLVCKKGGADGGRLYSMKMMQKVTIIRDEKTTEYTVPSLSNSVTLSRQTPNNTLFEITYAEICSATCYAGKA